MIRSAVTVCLVEQARRGPFVFHQDLPAACTAAAQLGFDAIELFAPSAEHIRQLPLRRLLETHGLGLAAAGTGAGMLIHQLSLCDADPARRRQAEQFIAEIIDVAAEFQAPAIIGSMQGRWNDQTDRTTALSMLSESLGRLGSRAAQAGTILLYEPLNRYETNLCTTLQQGCELIAQCGSTAVRLLADLFHMNIEEASLHSALLEAGSAVGHLHFVDSNRQAAGLGHIDFTPIAAALKQMRWQGYASAEAFPLPDSQIAAEQTIQTWRRLFGQSAD
ncbi:MAG TPA: sugar phosphate isomerase [Planctomycetaceae bacterium]|jgi:sugar phosphate isomerase/epimerase|nr:sugar phosphate isomerase [Planctomycetaceae bacterium]HCP11156.1 sugar phosphate isomerase [Planctomycetaceae bacterium]